jgi:hypothetical protein
MSAQSLAQSEANVHVPVGEQLVKYRSSPPSGLKAFKTVLTQLPAGDFSGHGEPVNAAFALACACGNETFSVLAHDGEGEEVQDPVHLHCAACGADAPVFDVRQHGYEGAMGHNDGLPAPNGPLVEVVANAIGEGPYRITAYFEYAADVMGSPAFNEWAGEESELFASISLVAQPAAGGPSDVLFDRACA